MQPNHLKEAYLEGITWDHSTSYNILKFATLRGYLTVEEVAAITKKRDSSMQEFEEEVKEEEFIEKYGPRSQWSDKVKELFDDVDS